MPRYSKWSLPLRFSHRHQKTCHVPRLSQYSWSYHSNNIWWGAKITRGLHYVFLGRPPATLSSTWRCPRVYECFDAGTSCFRQTVCFFIWQSSLQQHRYLYNPHVNSHSQLATSKHPLSQILHSNLRTNFLCGTGESDWIPALIPHKNRPMSRHFYP
jgi:hypothetical protein